MYDYLIGGIIMNGCPDTVRELFLNRLLKLATPYKVGCSGPLVNNIDWAAWVIWFNPLKDCDVILEVQPFGRYELALDIGNGIGLSEGKGGLEGAVKLFKDYCEQQSEEYEKRLAAQVGRPTEAEFKAWLEVELSK